MFEALKQRWLELPSLGGSRALQERVGRALAEGMPTPVGELRPSNGLKQFFWELAGRPRPAVLDLGPAWQSSVQVLASQGCKIYAEDLLRALQEAQRQPADVSLAERFLAVNVRYESESLDGLIAWDVLDYVPEELVAPLVSRFREILRPGGAVLAFFHNRLQAGERFHRYRITTSDTLEILEAPGDWRLRRIFQNRTLLNLFASFRSSKTFLSRENLREALFVK